MYAKVLKVSGSKTELYVTTKHFIAPAGEEVFAILGEDRILYAPIESDIGKNYAVRVVKGAGWNVKKIKVQRVVASAAYNIPKSFAKYLNIGKGGLVLAVGGDATLEIIPLPIVIARIGRFREPNILAAEKPFPDS